MPSSCPAWFLPCVPSADAIFIDGVVVERHAKTRLLRAVIEAILDCEGLFHQIVLGRDGRIDSEFDARVSRGLMCLCGHADAGPATALVPERNVVHPRVSVLAEDSTPQQWAGGDAGVQ